MASHLTQSNSQCPYLQRLSRTYVIWTEHFPPTLTRLHLLPHSPSEQLQPYTYLCYSSDMPSTSQPYDLCLPVSFSWTFLPAQSSAAYCPTYCRSLFKNHPFMTLPWTSPHKIASLQLSLWPWFFFHATYYHRTYYILITCPLSVFHYSESGKNFVYCWFTTA